MIEKSNQLSGLELSYPGYLVSGAPPRRKNSCLKMYLVLNLGNQELYPKKSGKQKTNKRKSQIRKS